MKEKNNNKTSESGWKHYFKMPAPAFFVCLGIAILGWFFVTYSKEYTVTLDFKVNCIDLPKGRSKATLSDSVITLNLRSKGFTFLKTEFSKDNRKLYFSVQDLIQHKGHNLNSYQFSKGEMMDYLKADSEIGNYVVDIEYPQELTVYLEK